MKYICDPCFLGFESVFSGSMSDIPGTEYPTLELLCAHCSCYIIPSASGHFVNGWPDVPPGFITGSLSGSQ